MRRITQSELKEKLDGRKEGECLFLQETEFCNMDLSGWDLSHIDFSKSAFHDSRFEGTNFHKSCLKDALFQDYTFLKGADFSEACLAGTAFRYCDLSGCDMRGANLFCAVFEWAVLDHMKLNKDTKWFTMYCPEEGAFLGYKKCVNDRLVQLLIPADAKRTSATRPSCRCSKAKVLTIKSFDYSESFSEAWSLVNEDFVYRIGEWVEVEDFNEDRWMDSTTGIHFWMTREEAKAY